MIFHIPYAMGRDITVRVAHESLSFKDTIVLHNAHFSGVANGSGVAFPSTPIGYYDDGRYDTHLYPALAPSGVNDPYWGPYYPYAYWGPYPFYRYSWVGWGGPGWTIGFGIGPAWGWGWPYSGWNAGYYHPGIYGYHHHGWWRPIGPRIAERTSVARPFSESRPPTNYRSGRGYRRGRRR